MSPYRFLLLLTALAAPGMTGFLHARVWTVNEAVTTALRQSPDVQSARQRIVGCEAMLQQVQSAWQPQLYLTGGYTATNNALVGLIFTMYQRNFGPTLDFNHPGWVDDLNATATAVYNLYSGGQPTARREAARAGTRAAEQDLRTVQEQLAAEVVKTMLNLRKARESVVALEAGVKAYESNLANSRLRFDAGQVLKADLLSLEVQTARTREQLSSARHAASLAVRVFGFVLGGEPTEESVELAENDPGLAELSAPDTKDFSQRSELVALQERLRMAEKLVEAARGGNRPVVNAYVTGQYDKGWHFSRSGESLQGGVTVEFNVFDGGRTSGKVRQAASDLALAKEQLRKAHLSIGLEVEQARLAHADAIGRLNLTTAAVAQAEESAQLSRARFEQGALLAAELIGTESRLIEMKMCQTLAASDERMALIALRRALGLPLLASR